MEKCVLYFIFFLAILIVDHVGEVKAVNKLACRFTNRRFKGKCGNNGNSICTREVKEFIAKYPDVSKSVEGEMRCNCTNIPVKENEEIRRECSCRYDCNFH
ncbi:hypothetical protein Bca4012_037860 [Brassica carinata]